MPLRHGPWIDPGIQTHAVVAVPVETYFATASSDGDSFDAICEAETTPWEGTLSSVSVAIDYSVNEFGWVAGLTQAALIADARLNNIPFFEWSPDMPWPSGAVDFEYELEGFSTADAILDLTVHLTGVSAGDPSGFTTVTVEVVPVPVASLTYDSGNVLFQNIPGAALDPVIGSGFLDVADATVNIDCDPITDLSTYVQNFTDPDASNHTIYFAVALQNQRTHALPPDNTYRTVRLDTFHGGDASMSIRWQPPRYRFLYEQTIQPPLRQRQRDRWRTRQTTSRQKTIRQRAYL